MKKTDKPELIHITPKAKTSIVNSQFYTHKSLSLKDIETVTWELIFKHDEFKDLRPIQLNFKYQRADNESYFETFFSVWARLTPFVKNQYTIYMNQNIGEALPMAHNALEAILAHELFHILDYSQSSILKLIRLGLNYGPKYERETDMRVVNLGYAEGLLAYRQWLYPLMPSPEAIEKKRLYYLTPEELHNYLTHYKEKA